MAPTLLHQPLSFDELNTALAGAHEEVRNLRQQYDELHEALFTKRLGAETRDQVQIFPRAMNIEKAEHEKDDGAETRDAVSQAQSSSTVAPSVPLPSDVPTEIASLSENEAKIALSVSGLGSCATDG